MFVFLDFPVKGLLRKKALNSELMLRRRASRQSSSVDFMWKQPFNSGHMAMRHVAVNRLTPDEVSILWRRVR